MPPEEVESLQRELTALASPEWAALLFHRDFKKHLEAAEQLLASLAEMLAEVQASLDLILRWAVLRICDGNMQVSGPGVPAWIGMAWVEYLEQSRVVQGLRHTLLCSPVGARCCMCAVCTPVALIHTGPLPPRLPHLPPAFPLQSLVKVLEMCRTLMEALLAAGYQLTDYEALVFLPAVVEKAGHNQVGGCEGARVWYLPFGLVGWGAAGGDDGAHTSPLGLGSLHHQPTSTVAPPPAPAPPPAACRTGCARCTATCCAWPPRCTRPSASLTTWCRGWPRRATAPRSSAAVSAAEWREHSAVGGGGGFDMWGAAGAGGPELLQLLTACLVVAIGM